MLNKIKLKELKYKDCNLITKLNLAYQQGVIDTYNKLLKEFSQERKRGDKKLTTAI